MKDDNITEVRYGETRELQYNELAEVLRQAMEDDEGAVILLTATSSGENTDYQLFHTGDTAALTILTADHVKAMLGKLNDAQKSVFKTILMKALEE